MTPFKDHAASARHDLRPLDRPGLWLCAAAATFAMATSAHAASTPDDLNVPSYAQNLSPKQAYEHDRAYCNSGQATEARALCLQEAARAYHEARAGKLVRPDDEQATGASRQRQRMERANTSGTGTASPDRDRDRRGPAQTDMKGNDHRDGQPPGADRNDTQR